MAGTKAGAVKIWEARRRNGEVPRVPDCHPDRKHVALGLCGRCYYRDKAREYASTVSEFNKRDRVANPEKWSRRARVAHLRRRYGMSLADYDRMLEAQGGRCANPACGRREEDQPHGVLAVDHDHETGVVRGLLCDGCNHSLGGVEDDVYRLQGLVAYLTSREGTLSP